MRHILTLLTAALLLAGCGSKYKYETVAGDEMQTRIYTLDNGLKVYLSRNDLQPRIQTLIAVRTGSKNDPAETTGLAHYLEHIMFKGSSNLGTTDYEAERPMLEQVEALYETYRRTTDEEERRAIYHQIDSISNEASHIAVANEYDKAMSQIGAIGTNAYTSLDETVYVNDIPSNQVDNWLRLEADRFSNMVIRGFHTELESVYEEYNLSRDDDNSKMFDALLNKLYGGHPYGDQTTIGRPEHLKNPSITNIRHYFDRWYRPDNVAIVMVGDIDFDKTIASIDRYWGDWRKEGELQKADHPQLEPINGVRDTAVCGQESEKVIIAWRTPKSADAANDTLSLIERVLLDAGGTSLVEQHLKNEQKTLSADGYMMGFGEYGALVLFGEPKEGQTLEQVRELLLGEVRNLIEGNWDESMLTAIVANMKREREQMTEDYEDCAYQIVNAFIQERPWEQEVGKLKRIEGITKQDIMDYAARNLRSDNYVCVRKLQKEDNSAVKITKPAITPIDMGRDRQSAYLAAFIDSVAAAEPIQPKFVDFENDLSTGKVSGQTLMYKKNTRNHLFTLSFYNDHGNADDRLLELATRYCNFVGTKLRSSEQLKKEAYAMACRYSIASGAGSTVVSMSGLDENLEGVLEVVNDILYNLEPDEKILDELKADILRERQVQRTDEGSVTRHLYAHLVQGKRNYATDHLSDEELKAVKAADVVEVLRHVFDYEHTIMYYGPREMSDVLAVLEAKHTVPAEVIPADRRTRYPNTVTDRPVVYVTNYDAAGSRVYAFSCRADEGRDLSREGMTCLFNSYFGGGMNGVVFQEMRESRGLCYSSGAYYNSPWLADGRYTMMRSIGTQFDKIPESLEVFDSITENMPLQQASFETAKEQLLAQLRTERCNGIDALFRYYSCTRAGLDHDINADIYETVQAATMDDLREYHAKWIKGRTYNYAIRVRLRDLDMNALKKWGDIKVLSRDELF